MTAAFLLMSSAALAGADVSPPPAAHPAPVVVSTGAGCSNCSAPSCGCSTHKVGLFDKLKSKFGKRTSDCGCAPVPSCAPVYVPPPAACNTCATSTSARPNLLDKLKSRCGHTKASSCGPTCGSARLGGGCATPGTPYVPPVTGTTPPPKEMPKDPKEVGKDPKNKPIPPKGGVNITPLPLPPVNGAGGLTAPGSPY